MNRDNESLVIALKILRPEVEKSGVPALLKAIDISIGVLTAEPDAYVTYKGYLLHASDPKVAEHSEPTPLYDLTDIIDGE